MKYKFIYFFDRNGEERRIIFEAENDVEAVLKFFDTIGIAEFGCIREDGHFFTDEKFPTLRRKIILGY